MRVNRKELIELIDSIEAGGGDATTLRHELETLEPEVKRVPPRRGARFRDEEEETMEERLTRRVGDIFPSTIPFDKIVDYDYRFTLKELREQAREAGLSLSGDKKELAAKLIAHQAYTEEPVYLGEGI